MTYDDHTPDITSTPISLPDDLTAQSLSALTSATLSPNHPAADLRQLNDQLFTLLHSEGDYTRLLYRQSSTLDALFHLMISHGLSHIIEDGKTMPDMEKLALALRAQRQCNDTVKDVAVIDYMRKMNFCEKNPSPPIPLKIQTNELKDGEND